jgi:hypothetical protein
MKLLLKKIKRLTNTVSFDFSGEVPRRVSLSLLFYYYKSKIFEIIFKNSKIYTNNRRFFPFFPNSFIKSFIVATNLLYLQETVLNFIVNYFKKVNKTFFNARFMVFSALSFINFSSSSFKWFLFVIIYKIKLRYKKVKKI